ncbi:MAG: RsmF rRNA methyltransferase first C-terminal domain-containing protein [Clostridia bacterium]|nr:RsmF rRNA methyltransferase first C-terminal domain-containing protein [Clostridia bacterium]
MTALPEQFKERMRRALGDEYPRFIACYDEPPARGLRVNTLRIDPEAFFRISPWELTPTGILPEGFVVSGAENVGRHPYHAAGLFYMQEPSAMSAVAAAGEDLGELAVLDMCAAPGGKTGGVAARMNGRGILVANEIVPKRAKLLAQNIERLGVTNAAVICERPDRIAEALPGFFDVVMVDAPCSGEGMFRKDGTAILEWSPEHVSACAERQKLIMESAADCVAAGGCIVYSTCTFSREENEGVIEDYLARHGDFSVEHMERLYPHTSCGEGHFVCRLRRDGEANRHKRYVKIRDNVEKRQFPLIDGFILSSLIGDPPDGLLYVKNDVVRLIPREMPAAIPDLHPVACGVELGELRKGRFEPSHTFFMAALGTRFQRELALSPDDPLLSAFLSGNTVPCPEDWRGYCAVSVKAENRSYPVGFGKAVEGTMKNHIPKGLYIN